MATRYEVRNAPKTLEAWLAQQFRLIAEAFATPKLAPLGTVTADRTVTLGKADLTTLTLGANLTLTVDTADAKLGTVTLVEIAQDATGGRTLTWAGDVVVTHTMTVTANKRDMVQFTRTGAGWVGTVLTQNY